MTPFEKWDILYSCWGWWFIPLFTGTVSPLPLRKLPCHQVAPNRWHLRSSKMCDFSSADNKKAYVFFDIFWRHPAINNVIYIYIHLFTSIYIYIYFYIHTYCIISIFINMHHLFNMSSRFSCQLHRSSSGRELPSPSRRVADQVKACTPRCRVRQGMKVQGVTRVATRIRCQFFIIPRLATYKD